MIKSGTYDYRVQYHTITKYIFIVQQQQMIHFIFFQISINLLTNRDSLFVNEYFHRFQQESLICTQISVKFNKIFYSFQWIVCPFKTLEETIYKYKSKSIPLEFSGRRTSHLTFETHDQICSVFTQCTVKEEEEEK